MISFRLRIAKLVSRLFFSVVPPRLIRDALEELNRDEGRRNLVMGPGSRLYPESSVANFSGNRANIRIGSGSHIRGELTVTPGGSISIGDNCYLGKGSVVRAQGKLSIGDNVLISHQVTIIDSDSHELDPHERALSFRGIVETGAWPKAIAKEIVIEESAWISNNVCLLKGVRIGYGAIVGAGSVVTKDVPPLTIVVGNPARVVRVLESNG